jgi:hypothetical protein
MPDMIASRAAACAARCCGFRAVADEIMANQLGPEAIARLFRLSARRDRGHIAAVVVLCGSIARNAADPDHWHDYGERELALSLIERSWFAEADRQAVRIVRAHWGEIAKNSRPSDGWSYT